MVRKMQALNLSYANSSWPIGYGGFSISVIPTFNSCTLTFLKSYGAIYAVANIRGGGEYGEDWHQAGIRDRKVS
jgi:prolyl oligopeptidase